MLAAFYVVYCWIISLSNKVPEKNQTYTHPTKISLDEYIQTFFKISF